MRSLLLLTLLVGLLTAPSLGLINVTMVPDRQIIWLGETTTISIRAQGTTAGIAALGGDRLANL